LGQSSEVMKRLKVTIDDSKADDNLKCLVSSFRKYQKLDYLLQQRNYNAVKKFVVHSKRKWKEVSLTGSSKCVAPLLVGIAATVEVLTLKNTSSHAKHRRLTFPKLKKLDFAFHSSKFRSQLIPDCANLQDLTLTASRASEEEVEGIRRLLATNDKLKTINVSAHLMKLIFQKDISADISFKLKSWETQTLYNHIEVLNGAAGAGMHQNFMKFLMTQASSLKELTMDDFMTTEVMQTIFAHLKLERLTIREMKARVSPFHIDFNPSLEHLNFKDIYSDQNIFMRLIGASPNLVSLNVFSMNQDMMEFLASRNPRLKKIHLRSLDAVDYTKPMFPAIEEAEVEVLNGGIENCLLAVPAEERSPFVDYLLKSDFVHLD